MLGLFFKEVISLKKTKSKWTLYIILTVKGRLYTGIATDYDRRFWEHCTDTKKGAKFFRSDPPDRVVYTESFDDRSQASKRESFIKSLSRKQKEALLSWSVKI